MKTLKPKNPTNKPLKSRMTDFERKLFKAKLEQKQRAYETRYEKSCAANSGPKPIDKKR